MIWMGIDVGKNGGYAIITGDSAQTYPYDDTGFVEAVRSLAGNGAKVVVEKVGAMPGQGVTSMFNFGKSAGFIEGALRACGVSYQLVTPQTWKKEYALNNSKQKSIDVCKRLFPNVNLRRTERCTKDHDGMAEALLMAEYARRKL